MKAQLSAPWHPAFKDTASTVGGSIERCFSVCPPEPTPRNETWTLKLTAESRSPGGRKRLFVLLEGLLLPQGQLWVSGCKMLPCCSPSDICQGCKSGAGLSWPGGRPRSCLNVDCKLTGAENAFCLCSRHRSCGSVLLGSGERPTKASANRAHRVPPTLNTA